MHVPGRDAPAALAAATMISLPCSAPRHPAPSPERSESAIGRRHPPTDRDRAVAARAARSTPRKWSSRPSRSSDRRRRRLARRSWSQTMPADAPLSRELQCLAGAIYFEARGEPLAGQLAVGAVIINRTDVGPLPERLLRRGLPARAVLVRARRPHARAPTTARRPGTAPARSRGSRTRTCGKARPTRRCSSTRATCRPAGRAARSRCATIDTHIFYR